MCKKIALIIMFLSGLEFIASDKKHQGQGDDKKSQAKELSSYYTARFANMSDEKTPLSLAEQFAQEEQDRLPLGQTAEPKINNSSSVLGGKTVRDDK